MDTNEFLAHYGVKGMRWGVRRGGKSSKRKPMSEHDKTGVRAVAGLTAATLAATIAVIHKTQRESLAMIAGGATMMVGMKFADNYMAKKYGDEHERIF